MTEASAAPAAKRTRIEVRDMILAVQNEADHARIWAGACTPGTASGLNHRADVLEAAATVVANAELAIDYIRGHAADFKKWREGKHG